MQTIKHYLLPLLNIKKEHMAILVVLLLFLNFPYLSRRIDVTSAPIDPGALSAILMAVLALLLFKTITWWLIKSIWPALAGFSEHQFEYSFKSLTPCLKVIIFLSFYLLLLFSFVLTLAALV